jgi:DUF971 family protein
MNEDRERHSLIIQTEGLVDAVNVFHKGAKEVQAVMSWGQKWVRVVTVYSWRCSGYYALDMRLDDLIHRGIFQTDED